MEVLRGICIGLGCRRDDLVESVQWPYAFLSMYFTAGMEAGAMYRQIKAFGLLHVSVQLKRLRKKDWLFKWKDDFRPFVLTKTFGVVPLQLKNKYRFRGRVPIYINADMAFGTGLHPTTRFMARLIERCRGRFASFLDLGTGTGILSILAEKCGGREITAVDIDASAVKTANTNCKKNACACVKVQMADAYRFRAKQPYDLVCANIITQDLIRMASQLVSLVKPRKYLAVSGISRNSYGEFRRAFARYPLRCLRIEKDRQWVALLYKKAAKNIICPFGPQKKSCISGGMRL